jgi:protein-disulfide isomerase/uncharacterized membrane protein
MSQKERSRSRPQSSPRPPRTVHPPVRSPQTLAGGLTSFTPPVADQSSGGFLIGALLLLVSIASSAMLGLEHLGAFALPGCGAGSPCARAAASVWGTVPGLQWPVSFLGLAYFLALGVAWIAARGRARGPLLWIIRGGVAMSAFFTVVALAGRYPCTYCLVAHAANIGFWVVAERGRGRAPSSARMAIPLAAGVFVFATASLGVAEKSSRAAAAAKAERELAESTRAMVEQSGGGSNPAAPAGQGQGHAGGETGAVQTGVTAPVPPPAAPPFSGRYRLGPDPAPIRIVMFTDYQCPDCKRIEGEVSRLLESNPDVSLSVKNFPMCTTCNAGAPNLHPNACWAARAAEAAGILYGNDGFWKMHRWLFAQGGSFTDADFPASLQALGFDSAAFLPVMQSPGTLERVQADVREATSLGLYFTPMIFVNGVELKGWNAPDAVARTVQAVKASHPPPRSADADHPPPAMEKYLADWREQPVVALALPAGAHTTGPADAPITVVLWGDYQEPFTNDADIALRRLVTEREDLRYVFRHFPVDPSCNPSSPTTMHPQACLMARAAEAAGALGGEAAFWAVHDWLMRNRGGFSETALRQAMTERGIDAAGVMGSLTRPEVASRISADGAAASSLGLTSIPLIYINGRQVPRWKMGDRNVLPELVQEAAKH